MSNAAGSAVEHVVSRTAVFSSVTTDGLAAPGVAVPQLRDVGCSF